MFSGMASITDVKHSFTSACEGRGITDFRSYDLRYNDQPFGHKGRAHPDFAVTAGP
jgi:hypothetical protein